MWLKTNAKKTKTNAKAKKTNPKLIGNFLYYIYDKLYISQKKNSAKLPICFALLFWQIYAIICLVYYIGNYFLERLR